MDNSESRGSLVNSAVHCQFSRCKRSRAVILENTGFDKILLLKTPELRTSTGNDQVIAKPDAEITGM